MAVESTQVSWKPHAPTTGSGWDGGAGDPYATAAQAVNTVSSWGENGRNPVPPTSGTAAWIDP